MASPTRSNLSPTASRLTAIIPNTTVISPRSISTRSLLEESISTLQNEQERVQKKTFTKWVNIYLSLHEPPLYVNDLFEDLQDGTKLIALLEVLSGQTLPVERGKKRAHCLSNVDNALKYLESRKIKLVNIRPIDIVDGKPMMILGLIWMLILCYQIEDANMSDEDSKDSRSKAKEALLEWVRKKTSGQLDGLNVRDFTSSWRDGLAFNALIHAFRPDLVDLRRVTRMDVRERLENAFNIAEQHLGIPRLIDAEDVDVNKPDEKSIMTYIAQFSRRFPDLPLGSINKEHGELLRWVTDTRQRLAAAIEAPIRDLQAEYKEYVRHAKEFLEKQKQWKTFERKESRSPHFPGDKLKELKDLFDDIALRMNRWRHKLDTNLPGELGQIADWINTAETVLARGLNFDPLKLSPEENIQRFTQLNEEHAAIFTDKEVILTTFQRLKRDPSVVNKQISIEHLTNLNDRLEILMNTSEERGRYLDFEQTHWRVQIYFVQLEYFIMALDKKQGDIHQTEKLYHEYKRKIHDEKLLLLIENLLPELTRKAQNYSQLGKKDDNISRDFTTYCENIRRTVKSVRIDLESKEHLLQETINSWKIYHTHYDPLESWLNEGEHVLRRSSEEKINYFAKTEHWSQVHDKIRLAIEQLMSVCDDEHATILRNKLLFINRRWKEIIESVQQFKHDESIKKKRDEFYAGRAKLLDTLDKIDREMQEHLPCTTRALKEQENRLYDAQAELEMFNQTVQILSKLSQTIARESGETNASTEMNSLLQICFDKLRHVQEYLPLTLKRNKLMLGHLQKFEDSLQKSQQWLHEAKQMISRYSIQVPVKRIEECLEQHRNFFADTGYYHSLIEQEGKLITTIKRANENSVPLNFTPIDEQYKQLVDSFEQIRQQTSYWEKEFSQHCQLWKDFHQRLQHLQEWIDQAQNLVKEKHDDYAYLIQKHKNFFQIIDDEILHGFVKSGRELLHIREKTDQKEIQLLMDTLESKWNTIICYAPIRLLRLQYERIENILVKELKQAEDELNDELRQLEKQHDTTEILRRHNERFQSNNFQPTMETYMKNLHSFVHDIRSKDTTANYENEQLDQRTVKLNDYWTRMQAKIDNVKRKLQTIPKKWQEFEEKFHLVETWMSTIERSMNETRTTEVSFDQYKIIVNKFKTDVQQLDTISHDVKTLTTLLDDLIEERATDDPTRYRHRLDTLLSRYRQLLVSIDDTSQYCSILIPAKMIHENSLQLNTSLINISNAPIHFRDLTDVRTARQGQIQVCDMLESLSQQVHELITRGNELMKQPSVPKYVAQDVQNIQRLYHEKVETAHDYLNKLKRLMELWERFDSNKRRYQQQTERLNSELSQAMTNRNSITSFQHEIENCKHLRTSYADLKSILDESAQFLQTISSNNLLPYENLQRLKGEYDQMVEELIEKLRTIDELLQDFIDDNNRWTHFNDELKRLETLFREIGVMFDANMFGERSLEEKQQILERVRTDLGEHLHSLSILHSDRPNLESLRCRPKDLQQVLNRLSQLDTLAETTSSKVNREEEHVIECRTHVQIAHRYLEQLHPWIEQAEIYLTKRLDQTGALNLSEAKYLYDKHKEFLEERRRMLLVQNNLIAEESNITDQRELKSLMKSLATRWNELVRKSDELTPKYDKQYSSWLLFESELNSFRDQILSELEQRVNTTMTIDAKKFLDLNRINTLLTELRVLDESIHHHTSNYNRFHKQLNDLRQYTSVEGQRTLHEEQMSIETRWHRINRLTTDKLRETERLYESRKSFHNRFEVFERSVRDIGEQLENTAQIQTSTLNQTLQHLQQIQSQLQLAQSLISTIGQELTELELAGLAKTDLQTIQNSFDTNRQRMNSYEIILQKRLDLLKRYEAHLRHSTDVRTKLQQIHDEIQLKPNMKIGDIEALRSQLDRYMNDFRAIQNESTILDRLMEESNSTITDSTTNRNIFFVVESRTVENLVDTIENKLIQRRIQTEELDRLLDDFAQSHTNLLVRINALSNNLRAARLLGYSPRDIEDLVMVIKTLHREMQNEQTQFHTLHGKYKVISSNLTNQERQDAEIVIHRIELELIQSQEQIERRQERLNTLTIQRQELDQLFDRLSIWYEEKQRLISSDPTIPLKTSDIERLQKKYTDTLNELKVQRVTHDHIIKLQQEVKQGYSYENQPDYDLHTDELIRKMNHLEELLIDRQRQFHLAADYRDEFDRLSTKLNEWMKNLELQIKDPLANDLQQTTNILKEKWRTIQSLLQSVKARANEFDDITRLSQLIQSTLNDTDRMTLDEKYTLLKDKYNRLLDNLTQRLALLDQANHERTEFDEQNEHVQDMYHKLEINFRKAKEFSLEETNERCLEQFQQLFKYLTETTNQLKELTRLQRALNIKGHRIDFRLGSELNVNLKNLDGQIQQELERIERILQTEKDFAHLDKELESHLQLSAEQLQSCQHQHDKGSALQTIADRLQQAEYQFNQLIHLSERLVKSEHIRRTIERRQERLQLLLKTTQQARHDYEHRIQIQQKFTEDLLSTYDWFRRLMQDFSQPLEMNLSLNNVNDLQVSINQLITSVDQRLERIEQTLRDEPNLVQSSGEEIRERLDLVEKLKHQVKNHLNQQRLRLDEIHQRMSHYLQLATEVKTAVGDVDFRLAPFFDGYDLRRLNEHEKELNHLQEICTEQTEHLVQAHQLVETLRPYLRTNARDVCDNQLRNFHQTIEDLETRLHQRRKELEDIRQKSSRFNASITRFHTDTDRLVHLINKSPETAENLVTEMDSTFAALQYLGRDLKKSIDVSNSTDIDRQLKEIANGVEIVRDTLDRAKKSHEENDLLRERIDRTLSKIKSFTHRKRQELQQSIDSGYASVDLVRRSAEMKSFIRDVDLEASYLSEVNELISSLVERKYDQQSIRSFEKKQEDILHDLQSLKIETVKSIENLDYQVQEQEKLRQNARTMLSILQRTKVQLIELRPTINSDGEQKLKKIDEELTKHFHLFEQVFDDYKKNFGTISDDFEQIIHRVDEEMEEIKVRCHEKTVEFHDYHLLRNEYEISIDNLSKIIQHIQSKTRKTNVKELTIELQSHRPLLDRLQSLVSTLTSQLVDSSEREQLRRRLNEITRRWAEIEQNLISEEEGVTEMQHVNEQYSDLQTNVERWLKQSKDLIHQLTNGKTIELFDQLIPKTRIILAEYQFHLEQIQRVRNRLNRLIQTNRTSEGIQKLGEIDRLLKELTTHRENLQQRLDLSQKMHYQFHEFNKQYHFLDQWIENLPRTIDNLVEQNLTIDEKHQHLHAIQLELDQRKQILQNLSHDYPQISHFIPALTQKLITTIDRIKTNVSRKEEDYEQYHRQQKEFRGKIEYLFEWIKQAQRYEPLSDRRDLSSLQREQIRLNEKSQQINDKSKEIEILLRNINSSKLPSDSLQYLRQELDHLKERLNESTNELETRMKFIKKSIRDVEENQRKLHSSSDSRRKFSSSIEHDSLTPGRSVEEALKSLDEQMNKFQSHNDEGERRKRQYERDWHLFLEEINLLQEKLNTFKQRKINAFHSLEEQLHFIQNQKEEVDQYQTELIHLKQHGQNLSIEDGNIIPLPSEIQLLQSMITLIKQQLEQRRASLTEAIHHRDIYLNECKLYEDAFNRNIERFNRSIPMTSTIDEYARQLIEQRISHEQMEENRRQLTLLYEQLDRETRARYTRHYHELEKRANDFQEQFIVQSIHSDYLVRIWREYQIRLDDLHRQFDEIEKQLLVNQRAVPFQQIQTAFVIYKDWKQRLTGIEPELMHLNDEIDLLARELNILPLQNDIQHFKEHFHRISHEIREKFDHHQSATGLANDIKRNLTILEDTLAQSSKESSTSYNGDVNELKIQLERMMDIEKRLDHLADVYSNTITLLKRLSTLNLYDLQSIENHLQTIHQQWTTLKAEVIHHESLLHRNLINNLPSRQACKEMFLFIDTIKHFLDDDHGASINNKETLQKLLQRYRDMRVDVMTHQRTMDYLNESFQQEANVDLTSMDYMENIKQINIDWIRIKSLISARIDILEQLNDQFNEFDQTIRTLSDWVQEQTSDLEFMRTRNFQAGAKDNIRRCNELEYQITSKQQILTSLKSYSGRMASSSSTFRIIDQDGPIQNLRHMLDHLTPSIEQLKLKSKSILTEWQEYNRVLLQMEKILREAEAEIDRVETSAMNVETYEMSTRKAQEYLQTMSSRRHDFDQITTHARQLSDQCDGPTSSKINEITLRLQQQWTNVEQRLQEIIKPSREVVENWRQFNTSYVHLLDRLGELEERWYTIQREKFTIDIDSLLEKAKDFQHRLQQLEVEVTKLHDRATKLAIHLPPIAGKKIDTQYSVINNQYTQLENFQIKLLRDCHELKDREKIYLEYLTDLTQTISHVQTILKSSPLIDIPTLKELEFLLQSKTHLIERLHSNEFLLYIKRAQQLDQLLIDYSHCLHTIQSRFEQIQMNEEKKLNFHQRYEKWTEYIQAIEQNLSMIEENSQTNYHGLMVIETNLANIIQDLNHRQYQLMELIKEEKQMPLEQRWQNLMKIAMKKQEDIKELIQVWLTYQNQLESYYRLLKGKCQIEQQELQTATINLMQQIQQGSYITTSENEELRNLLEKLYETNRRLIRHSDVKTQMILEKEWNDLQKSIQEIELNIKQRHETLRTSRKTPRKEKLLLRYNELDRTLDQLNGIVKSIRSLQQQPTDDVEKFLELCQTKNRELTQHRTELQRVRQAITEISPELHPEDNRQLVQKLNLLEIQWTDTERVLATLIDSLTRRHSQYQDFEHRFLRFIQWFEHFLNNELSERVDTTDVLNNEIRTTVAEKRRHVYELISQARALQSQSTDPMQIQIFKQKIEQLEQMINTIEQQVEKKMKKMEITSKMLNDFEEGFESLRAWMDNIERDLQRPVSSEVRAHQQSLASIEADVEKHHSIISNLLALGHRLLETRPRNLDSLTRSIQTIEQRWISLKDLLRTRKIEYDDVHISWRHLDEALKRASKMITDHERFLTEVKRTTGEGLPSIRNEYKSLENFKRTLDDDEKVIEQIRNNYSEILRTADVNGEIRSRMKELNQRWETLIGTYQESMKNLKYMLSVHGDFQLTQDSLSLWLTDLDVLLTNLEHLSEAPNHEKIRQLDNMDREIQEKQSKIDYVQTCANYLLNKTVDARGLSINMNELTKFCQQLRNLTQRIQKLKKNLTNTSSSPRSRSPHRSLPSYDQMEGSERRQRSEELLADFEDLLLQLNADFRSKEEIFHTPISVGVQLESIPTDFTYNRILISSHRKIDALHELIHQMKQEFDTYTIQDLNNDSVVLDIMTRWNHLQSIANEKDEQLNQHRQQWNDFKRQLENLEQAAQQFANLDHLLSRTNSSKSDVHERLDEFHILLKATIDSAEDFNDGSNDWILIEHRLRSIKDKFQFLSTKTNLPQREFKTTPDIKHELIDINSQLDHLESLYQSLEPIDENENNPNIYRTKLHRFIRIHDDLEILNERLIDINDHSLSSSSLLSNEQIRVTNDLKFLFDRLNSIRRIVRIHLEQLEKFLARSQSPLLSRNSSLRSSTNNLQRVYQ